MHMHIHTSTLHTYVHVCTYACTQTDKQADRQTDMHVNAVGHGLCTTYCCLVCQHADLCTESYSLQYFYSYIYSELG